MCSSLLHIMRMHHHHGSQLFSFTFLLIFLSYSTTGLKFNFTTTSTAYLSTTWTNNVKASYPFGSYLLPSDRNISRVVLLRETDGTTMVACGFICNGRCISHLFAIFFLAVTDAVVFPSDIIWSANRDQLVGSDATLNLTAAGELVLQDENGRKVWSSNTSGKSVVGMNLTDNGNLVLFDVNGMVVWQSFDHPTDCLVDGQKFPQGQKLIPSVSDYNWTAQQGTYYLEVTYNGLFSYVGSNPPLLYYSIFFEKSKEVGYVKFLINRTMLFTGFAGPSDEPFYSLDITTPSFHGYMKLMPDGHLKEFALRDGMWMETMDLLQSDHLGECGYPLYCGRNSICVAGNQCRCPRSNSSTTEFFRPVKDQHPNKGCSEITSLTCNSTQDHTLIALGSVELVTITKKMVSQDMKSCKQACMNNCSCKAVLFQHGPDSSRGHCHLSTEILTMAYIDPNNNPGLYTASAFLKVQNKRPYVLPTSHTPSSSSKREKRVRTILDSTIGSIFLLLVVVIGCIMVVIHKRKRNQEMEEDYLGHVSGMPARFSYEELKAATENFRKKLGQGGFGSVFEGTLEDSSKIAVKRLEGLVHTQKSFLAEVESIGNIHHVNLVRLRGFCSLKSKLLLVYEFMSNGSLDRWIYHRNREHVLNWECKKKIIVDIAKGLAYLHEDCRQRIIHLDIKPQNILLDSNFNAKIADFGMSKLIDKNQDQVMTNMRGTPGYMAPEWLSSIITEKVDVYSFGIVLLEILCGRKNVDRSEPEESCYLLVVFQNAWEQGKLSDMVDKYSDDMQTHAMEVVEMMKLVTWCLQSDFTRRPSMKWVIKVLEGVMEVESNLDYNFTNPKLQNPTVEHETDLTLLLPSYLSGPRYMTGFFFMAGVNFLLTLVATVLCVFFAPTAVGPGVPEIKAYLNGVDTPKMYGSSTMFVKVHIASHKIIYIHHRIGKALCP